MSAQDILQKTYASTVLESTSDMPILGYTVVSHLDSHLEVSFADLAQTVTPIGFGADDLKPPTPEPRTYVRRAITAWLKEIAQSGAGLPIQLIEEDEEGHQKKPLVREIKGRDKSTIVLGLVRENIDLDELGLSYLTNLRVFYLKPDRDQPAGTPGTLALTLTERGATDPRNYTPNSQEMALLAGLQKHVDHYREHYKSAELARMVKKIIESMASVNVRPSGGVYFVPYANRDKLIRLKELIEQTLPSVSGENTSRLMHIPVLDEPTSREQISAAAEQTFTAKTDALEELFNRVKENAEKNRALTEGEKKQRKFYPRSIRKEHMLNRIAEMDELQQEMKLYRQFLGVQVSELEAKIQEMEQQALELIGMTATIEREKMAERAAQSAASAADDDEDEDEEEE
jgi:hypothetical protein